MEKGCEKKRIESERNGEEWNEIRNEIEGI